MKEIKITWPGNGEEVALLRKEHLDFISAPGTETNGRIDWSALTKQGKDYTVPLPVTVRYEPKTKAVLYLSLYPDMRNAGTVEADNGEAKLYNLMTGRDYYIRIAGGGCVSETVRFTTSAQPPRWICIDGISNCRDIGGWKTGSGRRVRQGMIYRTSELDTHVVITEKGRKQLIGLGVRCEIDVRGLGDKAADVMAGSGIKYHNIMLSAYAGIFTPEQKRRYSETYRLLLDKENYPLFIHCWGGIDRTGTWVYILNGMLGVSDEDLCIDYELSSFACWGSRSRNSEDFTAMKRELMKYVPGDLRRSCESFMLDCGVAADEIDILRNTLTE